MTEPLISSKEAARLLGVKPQTLRLWRKEARSPRYYRPGGGRGRVFYRRGDIERWLEQHRYGSTSEEAADRQTANKDQSDA
jgi:DNA-binding transcriptional MerR regulator